jgi:hypothetical protein
MICKNSIGKNIRKTFFYKAVSQYSSPPHSHPLVHNSSTSGVTIEKKIMAAFIRTERVFDVFAHEEALLPAVVQQYFRTQFAKSFPSKVALAF